MPRFTAGTVITIPSGYGSRRSGYRFDGGQIVLSASDAARLNKAGGGNGRATRGGYSIPAEAFMDDAYFQALAEIRERQKAERRKIDAANGVRYMTPGEAAGYERWKATRSEHRMGWEEYQREILNSGENQIKRVPKGGVRTQKQAERLVEIIQSRGMAHSIRSTPVSHVNIPQNALGGVDLNGPLPLVSGRPSGNANLFWKSGQVFLYLQSRDVVGGESWNWHQVDPKQVSELQKLGPA